MIANTMRLYEYRLLETNNDYGTSDISEVKGQVKLSINLLNQQVSEEAIYKSAQFIGLTQDKNIDDTYFIEYDNMLLKVLYINEKGRYRQVYLQRTNGRI